MAVPQAPQALENLDTKSVRHIRVELKGRGDGAQQFIQASCFIQWVGDRFWPRTDVKAVPPFQVTAGWRTIASTQIATQATMAKSDAQRAKKVKKKRLAALARKSMKPNDLVLGKGDAVLASLLDQTGEELIRIESFGKDCVVFVAGKPTAGSDVPELALGMLLTAAVDDQSDGNESVIELSPFYQAQIEMACEKQDLTVDAYLMSLLPEDRRHLKLPKTASDE